MALAARMSAMAASALAHREVGAQAHLDESACRVLGNR